MFDAPSYRAREVETRAGDEAPGSGRAYVDTEHLLLAPPNDAGARSARSLEAVGAGDVAGLRDETVTSAPLVSSEQEAPGLACLDAGKILGGSVLLESLLPGRIRVGRRVALFAPCWILG